MRKLAICTAVLGVISLVPGAYAFAVPSNDGFVTDTAGILSSTQEQQLESELEQYRQQTSNEIAIVITPSLEDEEPVDAAVQIGRAWGVGTEESDNGIIILVSLDDRKVFIATGYGLEGAVPDIVAKGIVDEDIIPHFRNGDYFGGLIAAVDALKKHIGGEYTAERYQGSSTDFGVSWFIFALFFFQWIVAILARTKSWWLGGVFGFFIGLVPAILYSPWFLLIAVVLGLLLDFLVSRNYRSHGKTSWWAGGSWGPGGGGGGFGGFGGGSFGGGGAGGSW